MTAQRPVTEPEALRSRELRPWETSSALLLGGAAVMAIEVLGTRVVGPVFGVSLFVWAALLSVTLCSLAAGYWLGGTWVDRAPAPRLLGRVLALGGALLALVIPLRGSVLLAAAELGPRLGPLVAALVLFVPALTALGAVAPVVVGLEGGQAMGAGRSVGKAYALSTLGSLAGTLIISFWLIPEFETHTILWGTAAAVTALGAALAFRHPGKGVLAASAALLLWAAQSGDTERPARYAVRAEAESLYGRVQVIDDTERKVRFLRSDHSVVGAHWLADNSAAFAFLHVLESLPYWYPAGQRALILGLGSGSLPTALSPRGVRSDVVEIDPAIVRFAKGYFGFVPNGGVYVEDARRYVRDTSENYDFIVHDMFTGGVTPDHLMSTEIFSELRELLTPEGVLAVNFVGFQSAPKNTATLALMATLRSVFPHVRAFRDKDPAKDPDKLGNIIFFASKVPLELHIPAGERFFDGTCAQILPALSEWELTARLAGGQVVTDEHNPLARHQLASAAEHYHAMNQLLPIGVWVN